MAPEIQALSSNQQIVANILTQKSSAADQNIGLRSTAFIVAECILGFFTAGIATGIMELCHHFSSQPKVHTEFTNGVIGLKNALMNMAKKDGHNFSDNKISICGVDVMVNQNMHGGKLYAYVGSERLELDFTAAQLAERLQRDIVSHPNFFGRQNSITAFHIAQGPNMLAERSLCMDAMKGVLPRLDETLLATMSTKAINTLADGVLTDIFTDEHQLQELLLPVMTANRINGADALELLSVLEKAEKNNVLSAKTAVTINIPKYQSDAIKAQSEDVTKIRNMLADFISNEDTWMQDRTMLKPGYGLLTAMAKHAETLHLLYTKPELLSECGLKEYETQLKSMLTELKENFGAAFNHAWSFKGALGVLLKLPDAAPKKIEALEKFATIEQDIANGAKVAMAEVQNQVILAFDKAREDVPLNAPQDVPLIAPQDVPLNGIQNENIIIPEKTLDDMLVENTNNSTKPGYGQFVRKSLSEYFTSQSTVDQKAMLAASIRYTAANASEVALMGALLKGAGPIMQKVLQGLDMSGVNPEFAAALRDMKCNLAPIPDRMVKAYLYDMVQKSNGEILNITVEKSLGAASVGQAFLCKVHTKDGKEEECVIKLLRPNVQVYAHRERTLFERIANEIPGMEVSFQGQLKTIIDELDLTKEGFNIKKGAVYEGKANVLHSMQAHPLLEPTANAMILKKAPGDTLDNYLVKNEAEVKRILDTYAVENNKTVEELRTVMENVKTLALMHKEAIHLRDALATVATAWVSEGIYGKGFFHGDLHAGNIMVCPNKGATIIDYGNVTTLTSDQQANVTLMMGAGATGNVKLFMKGYRNLLSKEGQVKFDHLFPELTAKYTEVLGKGIPNDAGKRIAVCLTATQSLGVELPVSIFKFSQCQMRLQGSLDAMNTYLDTLSDAMTALTSYGNQELKFASTGSAESYQEIQAHLQGNINDMLVMIGTLEQQAAVDDDQIFKNSVEFTINAINKNCVPAQILHEVCGIMASCAKDSITFADCMGDVIMANVAVSVKRFGVAEALRLRNLDMA